MSNTRARPCLLHDCRVIEQLNRIEHELRQRTAVHDGDRAAGEPIASLGRSPVSDLVIRTRTPPMVSGAPVGPARERRARS